MPLLAVFAGLVPPFSPGSAWQVYLPYFIGAAILILGVSTAARRDVAQAVGLEKVVALGPLFFALPLGVFGADHFAFSQTVAGFVPAWIPWHYFWTYFVGACLIAAGVSLAVDKLAGLAAALFGIMLLLFELLISIRGVVLAPGNRIAWALALRDLSFSGGALAYAASQTEAWRTSRKHVVVTISRFFIAVPIVFFAVEQFLHPTFAPGVPLARLTPTWIPAPALWGYATAAVFAVTGVCLLANKYTRSASTWLGIMILFLVIFLYLPIVISDFRDIANGFNYLFDTLMLCGSALLFAGTQGSESAMQVASAPGDSRAIPA